MLTIPETDIQHYDPLDCAVFWKTKELYGGFSNMAGGYPLQVNDVSIRSSEALYQACRFPHLPEVQEAIFRETSPLYAKKAAYQHIDKSREDWMDIRIAVMEWTLRIKLLCNFQKFGNLLESTYTLPIVEKTVNRPDYWGG